MTIDQLRTFCRVAHRLNFTAVAHELHFSQSAVSQQIQALELAVSARLFDRIGRRLELTSAGERLLAATEPLLQELDDTVATLKDSPRSVQGRLLLGGSIALGTYVLPQLVSQFKRRYPRAEISLFIQPSEEALRLLWERRLHMALVEAPMPRRWQAQLQVEPFGEDEIVLIVAPTRAMPEGPLDGQEIVRLPLLLRTPGSATRELLLARLEAYGVQRDDLNVQFELGHTEALKRSVAAGIGVAFVPRLAVADEILAGKLRVVPLDPALDLRRHLFLAQRGYRSQVAQAFERMLWESPLATLPRAKIH